MRLQRGDFLRSIGLDSVARRIESTKHRTPITFEQQIDAVELEVELAVDADARRVWEAVAKTLRAAARAARRAAKRDAGRAGNET